MGIDDIKIVASVAGVDFSAYEGKRLKIAKVEEIEDIDHYPDGKTYNAASTEKAHFMVITTEPLKELDEKGNFTDKVLEFTNIEGTSKKVEVTQRFNLQYDEGEEQWVISQHAKCKLWNFMKKMKANKPSDLINQLVTLTLAPSKKPGDDRAFLRIVV